MADFLTAEDDTGKAWQWTLTDENGTAEDVSAGTLAIDIHREWNGNLVLDSGSVTLVGDGTDGVVSWQPSAAQMAELPHGHYKATITHTDGTDVVSYPRNTGASKYKTMEVLRRLDKITTV